MGNLSAIRSKAGHETRRPLLACSGACDDYIMQRAASSGLGSDSRIPLLHHELDALCLGMIIDLNEPKHPVLTSIQLKHKHALMDCKFSHGNEPGITDPYRHPRLSVFRASYSSGPLQHHPLVLPPGCGLSRVWVISCFVAQSLHLDVRFQPHNI